MILVAVVAVVIGGVQMWQRFWAARQRASWATMAEQYWNEGEQGWLELHRQTEVLVKAEREENRKLFKPEEADYFRVKGQTCAVKASYHAVLRRKYDRVASHPWLMVEPDPLEPDVPASSPPMGPMRLRVGGQRLPGLPVR